MLKHIMLTTHIHLSTANCMNTKQKGYLYEKGNI